MEKYDKNIFKGFIKLMPGAIYWKDTNGYYLACSDYLLKESNFKDDSRVVGKTDYDLFPKDLADRLRGNDLKVINTGVGITIEESIRLPDNSEKFFQAIKVPLKDENGVVIGILGNSVDITDRKKTECLTLENELQKTRLEGVANIKKISEQVAHDIRSPLASLLMIIESCKNIPELERVSLRKIASSISDIANNLLSKYRNDDSEKNLEVKSPQHILVPLTLSEILSHKKYQYKNFQVKFRLSLDKADDFIFIKADTLNFNRMISNLINNAVEAMENKKRIVDLKIKLDDKGVKIIIQDNGKGMPQNIVDKITANIAVTSGKENGNGIGFTQIRGTLQANNGKMSIDSKIGRGTKITLTFPRVESPDWIAEEIILHENSTVIILDDDPSIHEAWKARFKPHKLKIKLKHFASGEDIIKFVNGLKPKERNKLFLLSDFELIDQKFNGLQVIKKLNLQDRSILVTSHYVDQNILDSTTKAGIKVLPKQLAPIIPIIIEEKIDNKSSLNKYKKIDLVIVDDEQMLADALSDFFRSKSLTVDVYYNPNRFLENLSKYEKNAKICLDNDFGSHVTGVELAEQLNKGGYTQLYLFSGKSFEKNEIPGYLTVITKGDIGALNKLL